MAVQYVLQDRTTATKWALQIEDGQIVYSATADAAQAEPILEDADSSSDHWTVFIDDGELGWEATATVQDDAIVLEDTVDATNWLLVIASGQLRWDVFTAAGTDIFHFMRRGLREGCAVGIR